MFGDDGAEAFEHLAHGLVKLVLSRIAAQDIRKNRFQFLIEHRLFPFFLCSRQKSSVDRGA
jgi:hypothetical protein